MVTLQDRLDDLWASLNKIFADACHFLLIGGLLVFRAKLLVELFFIELRFLRLGLLLADLGFAIVVVKLDLLLHDVLEVADHVAHILRQLKIEVWFERLKFHRLVL